MLGSPRNREIALGQVDRAERFYLKMIDMEARGFKTLDNYQNFAKAFKVRDFQAFMASRRANSARLKSAVEFARTEMGEASELYQSVLRAVLYAIMELTGTIEADDVLHHLTMNIPTVWRHEPARDGQRVRWLPSETTRGITPRRSRRRSCSAGFDPKSKDRLIARRES